MRAPAFRLIERVPRVASPIRGFETILYPVGDGSAITLLTRCDAELSAIRRRRKNCQRIAIRSNSIELYYFHLSLKPVSGSSSEAETRQKLIDRQLTQAGWSLDQRNLLEEYILRHLEPSNSDKFSAEFADYVLIDHDSKPIAIVEAKKTSRDSIAGKRQAADYADLIRAQHNFDPFIFLSNGQSIWFWDRQASAPYRVSGFFSPDDLERLAFLRQYRRGLNIIAPDSIIITRPYQFEAIKRVTEAINLGHRHFLLVMATGTGKTRTMIALVDLLLRSRWVQRILFLADRRELVRQALSAFKEHVPNETRGRVEGKVINEKARIHVTTYPSMMQVYWQLSPGYYDLIIADESHRSIYNRYKVIFDYFAAMQLGLTATPTDYIDHNTFELFKCPDGLPTFYYPYETAVREGYLTNYRVLEALTGFQLQGIKSGQLPAQIQQQLIEKGIDLGEIDFEGTDLERKVTNTGTNDAIVSEFLAKSRKDAGGTLPAKTIIFAMSHRHALEIMESFRRVRPDLQRRGFAEVIDSHMERADKLLDDFKNKEMPRVAISVDMLDTGIDVPSIQNLVFAKPVFSQVKFWQMIGRGTRLWKDPQTGKAKDGFLIIDHWNNFAYFNMKPEGEVINSTEPLPVRLFRERLTKLERQRTTTDLQASAAIDATIDQLRAMLAELPVDEINVRPYVAELTTLAKSETWRRMDLPRWDLVRHSIARLLRLQSDVNLQVMIFELRTEKLAVAYLDRHEEEMEKLRGGIVEALNSLPTTLPEVQANITELVWMTSAGFWDHLDYGRIMDLQYKFAPLMRFHQPQRRDLIRLTLPDEMISRNWIIYGPAGEGAFADSYREQVEAYVRHLSRQLPVLDKLRRAEALDDADLRSLSDALSGADLFITEATLRQVYERPDADLITFMRHILGVEALATRSQQISDMFDSFIQSRSLSATQINFLRTVRSAVLSGARLTVEDMQKPPFSRVGEVRNLFTDEVCKEILDLANNFAA